MIDQRQDTTSDWYVLGAHTRRAVGYMGAALAERGYLRADFEQPILLDLWGEALLATIDNSEISPIGDGVVGLAREVPARSEPDPED